MTLKGKADSMQNHIGNFSREIETTERATWKPLRNEKQSSEEYL